MRSLLCLKEETVAAFVGGHLDARAMSELEVHAAGCADCQDLLAAALQSATLVEASLAANGARADAIQAPERRPLARGNVIGRYTLLELAGCGGMGEVYAAYDGELDRKVALKLLHARTGHGDARADARLLREARAMAKVSHPNAVSVHDVGTYGARVFVAMEFVDGLTLNDWLAERPRTRTEILGVFVAAARGLAAAHTAGLVHRDFKPQNVMIARDGTVRVMDFGLARHASADSTGMDGLGTTTAGCEMTPAVSPSATVASQRELDLTRTGELLGTPAYMAPEQFLGGAADARTDQFSFCVTLYEALYGHRPFAGETFSALKIAATTGVVREAPTGAHVSAWIRSVLLRGLDPKPVRRFPSMDALVAALVTDPTAQARRMAVVAAGVVCVVGVVLGVQRLAGTRSSICNGGAQKLVGIWEPPGTGAERKERIHAAFSATGRAYAGRAYTVAAGLLDEYVSKWLSMYRDTCEATHVRGEQSTEVLDLRMSCLQERLGAVGALTNAFALADGNTVENAATAAAGLPRLERCADVPLLKAVIQPPRDEPTRKRVDHLRGERARLVALRDSGHCVAAHELAIGLVQQARSTGYLPLLAETLSAAGYMYNNCASSTEAMAWLQEAFSAGLESHNDETVAEAAILLSGILGDAAHRSQDARSWLGIAHASIERVGNRPLLEAWWLVSEGAIFLEEGRPADALAAYREALATKERILGKNHPDIAISLLNVAYALQSAGRFDEALTSYAMAIAEASRILGPEHPYVGRFFNNEGEVLNLLKRHAQASVAFRHALEIFQNAGSDPEMMTYPLTGLGLAYLGSGQPEASVAPLELALKIRTEHQLAPELTGEDRFALARALWSRPADRSRALDLARAARADYARVTTGASSVAIVDAWLKAPAAHL